MLRQGIASADIAQRLNVSPPLVWEVTSQWYRGEYGDKFDGEPSMTGRKHIDDVTLISSLAEGVDPFTGEVLRNGHLLQHPQIVRALFHSIHALEQHAKSAKRDPSRPTNAGAAWNKEEDAKLAQEFDSRIPIPELAKRHGRSKGAITSRLIRLGKIKIPGGVHGSPTS